MCTNPKIVRVKKIEGSPLIKRDIYRVPCGKCEECKNQKKREYELRGIQEYKRNNKNIQIFITLTYNNENLPKTKILQIPQFSKKDITDYVKRVRENIYNYIANKDKVDKKVLRENEKIKYIITSEYGELRKRPHYHACISIPNKVYALELIKIIQKTWTKGYTMLGNNFGIINSTNGIKYVTKYITKSSGEELYEKEIEKKYIDTCKKFPYMEDELKHEWEKYEHKFFHISNEYGDYEPSIEEWRENKIYVGEKGYTIPKYYKYKYLYNNEKIEEDKWQRKINEKGIQIFNENYEKIIQNHLQILSTIPKYNELTQEEKEYIIIGRFHRQTNPYEKIDKERNLFNQDYTWTTTIKDIELFDKYINSTEKVIQDIQDYAEYIKIRNAYLNTFKNKKITECIKQYDKKVKEYNDKQKLENIKTEKAEVGQKMIYEKWVLDKNQ